MGYIYMMNYDSAIKKNQMLFLATSQRHLLHFSEIAKVAKDKYHVSSDVWQISKIYMIAMKQTSCNMSVNFSPCFLLGHCILSDFSLVEYSG